MPGGAGSWLGLARSAGRLAMGSWQCRHAIAKGQAALLVIAADASAGTRRRFAAHASKAGCPWVVWGTREEIGRAAGSSPKAVVAFLDEGLAVHFREAAARGSERARPPGRRQE